MKIKPDDFEKLRAAIAPLDTPELRAKYAKAGCSAMRYRWDLLYASKVKLGDGRGMPGDIEAYAYLNDTHIDRALKRIVPFDPQA